MFIRGGQLTVATSSLKADMLVRDFSTPALEAGTIEVHASAVTLDQATISASASDHPFSSCCRGDGGQIRFMDLGTLSSTNSILAADAAHQGDAGSISVGSPTTNSIALTATTMRTFQGFNPFNPRGGGGHITLTARTVSVDGGGLQVVEEDNSGPAGHITLNADRVAITGGAGLIANHSSGTGEGGDVTIQGLMSTGATPTMATEVITDGAQLCVCSTSNPASGGSIVVRAGALTLNNTDIHVAGAGTISLADVGTLTSTSSSLFIVTHRPVPGGSILLGSPTTSSITLQDTTLSSNSGNINLTASAVSICGGQINTDPVFSVPAGNITANVGTFTLSNGAKISSSSTFFPNSNVDAGTVTITATGAFQSTGSTVTASAGQGTGGAISITAGNLSLTGGSTVTANSEGGGNAGTIQLKAGHNIHLKDSVVTANSKGSGNAGSIQFNAGDNICLKDSAVTAQSEGTGNVGTIRLEAGHKINVKDSTISPSPTIVSGQTTE